MTTQLQRRHDPYPLTWEIPLAAFAGSLLVLVLGVHLGRAIANLAAGTGWLWPAPAALFTSVPAVLQGDAGAGLTTALPLADPPSLFGWVLVVEVLVIAVCVVMAWLGWRRWGSRRVLGLASADEARRLLGWQRLHSTRRIVRPDLYARKVQR